MTIDLDRYDFELPADRIAQHPPRRREDARLMTLDSEDGTIGHRRIPDLPTLLRPGDMLVFNDTRVVPARVGASRTGGGRIDLLFLDLVAGNNPVRALGNRIARLKPGERLRLDGGGEVRVVGREGEAILLESALPLDRLLRGGRAPLPPYIRRAAKNPHRRRDLDRYQTVFARTPGAIAAPTAGLHFTRRLLDRIGRAGIRTATVTLHVGRGTFRPLERDGRVIPPDPERFIVPGRTLDAIRRTRKAGGRVVAVGTTTVRALESAGSVPDRGRCRTVEGGTDLFIRPGHPFRNVDAMLTNFHLPRSGLLVLVAAFAGRERILAAYREAITRGYRFYSYGDAMLIGNQ